MSNETRLSFEGPNQLRAMFEAAKDHARTPYNAAFVEYVADAFIKAGLAKKEEYRFCGADGFLNVTSFFPPGSGAVLTKDARALLYGKCRCKP
jgi:hypothetical protein